YPEVIEAARRRYPGRARVNSVSIEEGKMEKLFPAIKKYGAMFILLPLSQTGLPKDMEEKKRIIQTILAEAEKCGLCREDVLVDGLVNTVGANPDAALAAVETIRYCKEELGVATMCGLSNISFGLPQRPFVNAAFLAFAIQAGITAAIVNPSQELLMTMAAASDLLRGREGADLDYIRRVTERPPAPIGMDYGKRGADGGEKITESTSTATKKEKGADAKKGLIGEKSKENAANRLYEAVLSGNRKGIVALAGEALASGFAPQELLNGQLIPAINEVGELFNQQKYFLPQLIASAEAMKTAVEYLEPLLSSGGGMEKQGVVVIATVAGDVHDIGKNLVALMLKNYGFDVHDLGKDVPTEEIIRIAKELDADLIAVSALMTTTMLEMKEVVRQRDAFGLRAKIMIGGAVITQGYCDEIHADGYSKDAQEAVDVAKRLVGSKR
ncbi:MAG: cobalamin-dependent protein, partial [Lachnospiraceae bacterium]|nr:cobalamin-dependent protein [Lachnospiraceae bacterium]